MPINNIPQPEIIHINDHLRLHKYSGTYDFALPWYSDPETLRLIGSPPTPYTLEKIADMYEYLERKGELYFIEILEEQRWLPIGDVTFCHDDMPILIGEKRFRSQGTGKAVVNALVQRGKELGYTELYVEDIYDFNTASIKCFTSAGFIPYRKTPEGHGYHMFLKDR